MQDYQKDHDSARNAAEYAAQIDGWSGMYAVRQKDGRYKLTLEWANDSTEAAQKKDTRN